MNREQIIRVLETIGLTAPNGDELHLDASFSFYVTQELQSLEAAVYRKKYPELKGKILFPVDHSTPSGAQTTAYDMYDEFGEAAMISNYADDLPLVDLMKERFVIDIKSFGDGYVYSIQDIRAAQMASGSVKLDQEKPMTARRVVEHKFDQIIASGYSIGGIRGALNHPNIPLYSPITGTWSTATAAQMLADLHSFPNQILDANNDIWEPDTMILDPTNYRRAAQTRIDTVTGETVLQAFLRTNGYIKNVESWLRCRDMNAAGDAPRAMCYKRDPEVLVVDIPQEFEQLPPQAKNLAFKVPCHGRIAGVKVRYPLACGHMDGLGA
jgi:hypothetical protein